MQKEQYHQLLGFVLLVLAFVGSFVVGVLVGLEDDSPSCPANSKRESVRGYGQVCVVNHVQIIEPPQCPPESFPGMIRDKWMCVLPQGYAAKEPSQ